LKIGYIIEEQSQTCKEVVAMFDKIFSKISGIMSAIFLLGFFLYLNNDKLQACQCLDVIVGGLDREKALVDSLNLNYTNDTNFLRILVDSVSHAKKCFIGNIKSIKINKTDMSIETLTVHCERKIKGAAPDSFKVLNFVGHGDCSIYAQSLVGKKFLSILQSDTIPSILRQLGVVFFDCGVGYVGIFVTETRIVTFYETSAPSGPKYFTTFARNANLQQFINETNIIYFPRSMNRILVWQAAVKNRTFSVNGRFVTGERKAAGKYFYSMGDGKNRSVRPFVLFK
jgi:hypothetical protein